MFKENFQLTVHHFFHHRLYRILLFCAASLATVFTLPAQNRVDVWIDTNQITIGDQAHVYLKIMQAPGSRMEADLSAWDSLPGFEVISQTPWDTLTQSSGVALQKTWTITSFDSGAYVIPSLVVRFDAAGASSDEIITPELRVVVQNPPVANLAPIRDIVREGFAFEDFLPFIIGGFIFLLLVYGISRWLHREKKLPPPPPVPEVPLSEQALRQLNELRAKQLWQTGRIKEYETELTFIIRNFLKLQYDVPALEATTGELIGLLQNKGFDPDQLARLRSVLEVADLVKFAKATPEGDIYDQALVTAEEIVRR